MKQSSVKFQPPMKPSGYKRHGERWAYQIAKLPNVSTPFMIVDIEAIRDRCRTFKDLFPQIKFYYAIKAFSDKEVIKVVQEYADGFDAASIEEIEVLLSLGVAPECIGYNNPVKPQPSIKHAYALGVRNFAFQSRQELDKIAASAPGSNVYARMKMDDSYSAVPLSTKYGCDMDEVGSLLQYAQHLGLTPAGVTFHVGSQQTSFEVWMSDITNARGVLADVRSLGIEANTINIGGGLPAQYSPDDPIIEDVARVIKHALGDDSQTHYIAEPGRFVVANSAAIVTTVIGRERRNDHDWLYLDVGLFQAFVGASRFHPFPYPPFVLHHESIDEDADQQYILTGPSCDSQDIITREAWLPKNINVGDRLVFPNTGAYTIAYGSEFNGFKPPERIYIDSSSDN